MTGTDVVNTFEHVSLSVPHDRIHARKPTHDHGRWRTGIIEQVFERDGHCLVVVNDDGKEIELRVTFAIRDLFVSRLDLGEGESPVGSTVWYRKRGQH